MTRRAGEGPAVHAPGRSERDGTALPVRISALELTEVRLRLREPFQISSGTVEERRVLLLRLHHPDGPVGWSECVAAERPNYSPETVDTAWLMIRDFLGPAVLDRDFRHPGEVHDVLEAVACGHPMAKAAIEMGAWELAALLGRRSLSEVLGGTRDVVETGISIGIQSDPDQLVERARNASEQGYRKIKLKIKPGADVRYVQAVREALGPDASLMVDANAAYTLADADHLAELDGFGLLMIEQPLARDDLVRHAELQRRISTPICLDESIGSPDRAEDMLALGSGRIINIKPGRVGGFTNSLAIHDLCARAGIPVWCGGMLESGVGRAHNVALASLPNFLLPGAMVHSGSTMSRSQ
jgi:o-succinylbenzoate synthase